MLSCVSPHLVLLVKKLFGSLERMDGFIQRNVATSLSRMRQREQYNFLGGKQHMRCERIIIEGEVLSYVPDDAERVGVFIAAQPLSMDHNYFEIELLDTGILAAIVLGLVSPNHPLDKEPGLTAESVGYHVDDGHLYKGRPLSTQFGPKCMAGDRIGCGIKFDQVRIHEIERPMFPAFFTRNGREVGSVLVYWPPSGLFPAISMHSPGEEVKLAPNTKWLNEEDILMSIDDEDVLKSLEEDEWSRLHDIRLNGQILEYTGRGKSIIDVGLAQARSPLNTTSHYFEIEILDPGENCYIAIGLTRKDYPKSRHPGWNKGSIAYHADDGKIFIGSGMGDPFGPRCHKGDIMGCGIIFPRDFICCGESEGSHDLSPISGNDADDLLELDSFEDLQSDSEDENWWDDPKSLQNSTKVQVFFTRNGKIIGQKEVCIPKGGFFPTVGMLSSDEKVKVDLRPLTG